MNKQYTLYLGDNPFFGVNHLSQEFARKKADKSQDFENIKQVMNFSLSMGIKKMVVSTHPELKDLMDYLKKSSNLINNFEFYPILPYIQGYVTKVSELGMTKTIQDIIGSLSLKHKIRILTKGSLGAIRKDFDSLFKVLLDLELVRLGKCKIKTVFLHDVITDLALGLEMKNVFEIFHDYIKKSYSVECGLVTKNFPLLVSKLNEWNLEFPKIMTSFNNVGFQMNPSREKCEHALSEYQGEIIAMSILAGGFLQVKDAYQYLSKLQKISNVVIGVSSIEHAKKTFEIFLEKNKL